MRWSELAAADRRLLSVGKHLYLATVREDGSPRISGAEVRFSADGADLWFGAMPASRKVRDLRHDPRFALHGRSEDPPGWSEDGKIAGVAVPASAGRAAALLAESGFPGDREGAVFLADLTEAVITRLGSPPDHLDITLWKPGRDLRTMRVD
ncbi:MAG: pyridoxamine 5'-phosphate oxidase family protein [Chloroflexota bacterium]